MAEDTHHPETPTSPVEAPTPESPRTSRRAWPKRKKMIVLITAAVCVLLLIAGVIYWLLLTDGNDKHPTQTKASDQQTTRQTPPPTPEVDATPVTFKSTKLNIELTHRKDWKLKEATDGEITITSPQLSYTTTDGKSKLGVFTFKMRKGVTESMKATIDKTLATKPSEVIAYAAPTEQQRQYTNVSYVGTPKDVFNFFIVTGSVELKAGNTLGYSLSMDDEFYLIVGGYGTGGSNLSFDSVPKDFMDSTTLEQAIDIAESIKIF